MDRTDKPYSYRDDPAVPSFSDSHPIIVFDGNCRMCSRFVRFVLHHDAAALFRFVAAQSMLGSALYLHYGLNPVDYESNILLENGQPWLKSEGSIRIFARLGLPWSLVVIGRLLPLAVRDHLYEFVARNRLRWFGVRTTCLLLEPGYDSRFLE